jgi:hypothetical protein
MTGFVEDCRTARVGDKVVALDSVLDNGKIDAVKGPEVFVDWDFVRGGEHLSEYVAYYVYDLTWDEGRRAWTIPTGHMGHA